MPDMRFFLISRARAVKFMNDATAGIKLLGGIRESVERKTRYIGSPTKRISTLKPDIGKELSECISIIKRRRLF